MPSAPSVTLPLSTHSINKTHSLTMHDLLNVAFNQHASDLHLSAGMPVMARIDSNMVQLDTPVISDKEARQLVFEIMSDEQQSYFEQFMEIDFAIDVVGVARFRVNVFHQSRGIGAVFRSIPNHVLNFDDLGIRDTALTNVFKTLANLKQGIILVTGATGSGKSTTLSAMINEINTTRSAHILTIEDPIEFIHESKKSLINQREVNKHTLSFDNALRSALREDPDVILVGELRDYETIRLALTAAETGHLVLATLHTNSAPKTIDRIIDAFPASDKPMIRAMLSESLKAVISQTLVKRIEGGRVAAFELMLATPAIRNLIRENKLPQMYSAIQTGSRDGMQTLDYALQKLVTEGVITKIDALNVAKQPEMIR